MPRPSSPASLRRSEKVKRDAILSGARSGDLDTRVAAQTAYRIRILRETVLANLPDPTALEKALANLPESTALEEAGALLEAETAQNLQELRNMYQQVHREE